MHKSNFFIFPDNRSEVLIFSANGESILAHFSLALGSVDLAVGINYDANYWTMVWSKSSWYAAKACLQGMFWTKYL